MTLLDRGLHNYGDSSSSNSSSRDFDGAQAGLYSRHGYLKHMPPLLPARGPGSEEATGAFPDTVAASLASLRSMYDPKAAQAPLFSPLSRRRRSLNEPLLRQQQEVESPNFHHANQPWAPPDERQATHRSRSQTAPSPNGKETSSSSSWASSTSHDSSGVTYENHDRSGILRSIQSGTAIAKPARLVQDHGHLGQLFKHATKLQMRRTTLSELLESLRAIRGRVEQQRRKQNQADLAFFEAARTQLADNPHLIELLDDMSLTRQEQIESDQRIDEVVGDLLSAELALDMQERVFFSAASGVHASYAKSDHADSTTDTDSTDSHHSPRQYHDLSYELTGISGLRHANIHPLLSKLLAAGRELKLADEFLINLQGRKRSLDRARADLDSIDYPGLRQAAQDAARHSELDSDSLHALDVKFSRAISKDDAEFLQSYSLHLATAIKEKEQIAQRISFMVDKCLNLGLVLPNEYSLDKEGIFSQSSEGEELDLRVIARNQHKHSEFPLLLSNPAILLAGEPKIPEEALISAQALPRSDTNRQRYINQSLREINIYSLLKVSIPRRSSTHPQPLIKDNIDGLVRGQQKWTKGDWINRWLLHKLHMSVMEAETFFAESQVWLNIVDRLQWQKDVLCYWAKDDAAAPHDVAYDPTSAGHSTERSSITSGNTYFDAKTIRI
ncbi:hypothetical protein MN608_05917 [Microdochium nivale]|nr:hypothetical protein MN608_05917 [Microdochium nivale]